MVYALASEFYPDYPDPLPAFTYLGEQGRGLIESALAAPRQTFEGRYPSRTTVDKAAVLYRSLTRNHGLVDGNKRLALTALGVFLAINGYLFFAPRYEAISFTVRVANPETPTSLREITGWVRRYSISWSSLEGMNEG